MNEHADDNQDDSDHGLTIESPLLKTRLPASIAKEMARYAKWFVLAIALSLVLISFFFGLSLVWNK